MPAKIYRVNLSEIERNQLVKLTTKGSINIRKYKRACILLYSDESIPDGCLKDAEICSILGVAKTTVSRIRQRFVEGGIENALSEKPRPGKPKKITGKEEAKIIALACSDAPKGYARWSLRLLADKLVTLEIDKPVSHMAVQRILKKRNKALASKLTF